MSINAKCVADTLIYGALFNAVDENGSRLPLTAERLCENKAFENYSVEDVRTVLEAIRICRD